MKNIQEEEEAVSSTINVIKKQQCKGCGEIHRTRCPTEGVTCHLCKKQHHYAKMCQNVEPFQHQQWK